MRAPILVGLLAVVGATAAHGQQRDTLPVPDMLPIPRISVSGAIGVVLGYDVFHETTPGPESVTRDVQTDPGLVVRGAAEYRFGRGISTFAMLEGSIAKVTQSVTTDTPQPSTSDGTTTQVDLMAGLRWRIPIRQRESEPVSLHAAGGAVFISGPNGIPPYLQYDDRTPFYLWEVGISVHPGGRFGGVAAYQSIDVEPEVNENGDGMRRIILALRIAMRP